ncbi:MAG: LCP family protein [Parasporobacterium sp.]|nr:LCP family protein [Parasporobacterium sp.]
MSSRTPKRISNEEPHKKLDPREVKYRARDSQRTSSYESQYEYQNDSQYQTREMYRDDREIEEDISYSDHYDDVRAYSRKKSGPSTGRKVIGKILLYLQLAASVVVFILLLRFQILSAKKLLVIGGALLVIWLIIFISQRKKFNKIQAAGMVISILLSIVLVVGSLYLVRTNQMLKQVTSGKSYDISLYDVVVRTEDAAQAIEDTGGYRFAIQPNFRQADLQSVISQLEEELGGEIQIVEVDSVIGEAEALMAGDVEAAIYNDVFNATILEQYEDYESYARVLKTYTVRTEAETVQAVDVDVSSDAFLILISGNDSEGEVSLTGRSDVDIVAGINTTSKEVLLITIPRDYYVEFPGITAAGSRDKLTHAGIYGMEALISTVENLIGYKINYYVRLNFSSMMNIVDAMGGVTIYNEQDFISHGGIHFPEGMLDLNGDYALHYVRERYAFEDGDFARGRNQIKVIQAMMDKLVSVNTLANYNNLMTAISESLATNIPTEDLMKIVNIQLNENPQWHVVSYQMLGAIMFQPCQSANGAFLSVDMPYKEAVDNVSVLLGQLYGGEVLSEDLQLSDNGLLTYITQPVG